MSGVESGEVGDSTMRGRRRKPIRLTLVFDGGREEFVDQYASSPEAVEAFEKHAQPGVRGLVEDFLAGVSCWLPTDSASVGDIEARSGAARFNIRVPRQAPEALAGAREGPGRPPSQIEAFGEVKTIAEWSRDPRCRRTTASLRKRLRTGMDPESAMGATLRTSKGKFFSVFGEGKTAMEWSWDLIDWEPKRWGRPPRGFQAFGEVKSISEWSRDPRCKRSAVSLRQRLDKGMDPESAMAPKDGTRYSALGEEKTLGEWSRDPRCHHSSESLGRRLKRGIDLETALTTTIDMRHRGKCHSAFGEEKTLTEWSNDPWCHRSIASLRERVRTGMDLESAMAPTALREAQLDGTLYLAFGEEKTLDGWSKDPRCRVMPRTFTERVLRGVDVESALTSGLNGRWPSGFTLFEGFGASKTLRTWLQDERCVVDRSTAVARLSKGVPLEQAITELRVDPPRRYGPELEGFGESKSLFEWAQDSRCVVPRSLLEVRLKAGVSLEEALTTAPEPVAPKRGRRRFLPV